MILIMGPSGAGKSSQAKLLETRHPELVAIGPGELLRQTSDPKLAQQLSTGELIDDSVVFSLLKKAIASIAGPQEVILDGYPRRMSQVAPLEQFEAGRPHHLRAMIVLTISRQTAVSRLTKRGRTDDIEQAINRKWQIFEAETSPVIAHYKRLGLAHEIDGEGTIEVVAHQIELALGYAA